MSDHSQMDTADSSPPSSKNHRSEHTRIFVALASVSTYLLIAKAFSALKEVVVASRYGVSATMDAYVYFFNITNWPVAAAISISTISLLPLLIRMARRSRETMRDFRREFFGFTILLGTGIGAVLVLASAAILHWNLPGFSQPTLSIAWRIAWPMMLMAPLGVMNAFLSVRLMAQYRHGNSLFEAAMPIGIIATVLLWPVTNPWPLVAGTILGAMVQMLLLATNQDRSDPLDRPSFCRQSLEWPPVLKALGIVAAGQVVLSMTEIVDQSMVAHLGVGTNATLGYASRLLSLALTLGVTALTRALLPVLTDLHSKDQARIRGLVLHWIAIMFCAGIVATTIGYFAAPLAISVLYQRGAFSAQDTIAVAHVLRMGLVELPFYFAGMVVVQFIASRADFNIFFITGIINIGVKIAANALLIPLFGISGVMLASAVMYAVSAPMLWFLANRRRTMAAG